VLEKIVSGGQTGPDRAALDFARARGMPHAGWCPLGRWAEDGPIDSGYLLTETPESDPQQRTEWNVRDSDGTVIFSIAARLSGGSKRTFEFAEYYNKPCLHLSLDRDRARAAVRLAAFLKEHAIKTLNVAGPRTSGEPEAGGFALETLCRLELPARTV
jgi:putative molybdenum carrier protein